MPGIEPEKQARVFALLKSAPMTLTQLAAELGGSEGAALGLIGDLQRKRIPIRRRTLAEGTFYFSTARKASLGDYAKRRKKRR